jgi:succinate dehydrogenase / fumarate reductase, flavoprotein subunit
VGRLPVQPALVNPTNKRKFDIIVIGSGLAGASAGATLGELGYNVKLITYHDSPRRAHSISAQGGINAAKNYRGDGDSIYRLFYDTVKGGDFRSREANVYRLAQVSLEIIDQCVAQGVPFAREYGGLLDTRSSGAQGRQDLLRARPDRPAAAARRLPGAHAPGRRRLGAAAHPNRDARSSSSTDGRGVGVVTS